MNPPRRTCGVPDRGNRGLRGHQHVRAMMFHRLESRDGPTELLAHLGVFDRCSTQSVAPPAASAASSVRARARADARAPGRRLPSVTVTFCRVPVRSVGSGRGFRHLDRDPGASAVQQQHVVTGNKQQQVGQAGAEHDTGVAVGDTIGNPHVPTRPTPAVTVPSISPGNSRVF